MSDERYDDMYTTGEAFAKTLTEYAATLIQGAGIVDDEDISAVYDGIYDNFMQG